MVSWSSASIRLLTARPVASLSGLLGQWSLTCFTLQSKISAVHSILWKAFIPRCHFWTLSYRVITTVPASSLATNWEIIFMDTSCLHAAVVQRCKGSWFWHWLLLKEVKSYSSRRLLRWLAWFSADSKLTCLAGILLLNAGFGMPVSYKRT